MQKVEITQPIDCPIDITQTVLASSHVLIRDKQSGQTLVNKRGS